MGKDLGLLRIGPGTCIVHPHSSPSFLPSQDQERRTPLHAAAYVGDVPILQLLLMSGESGELEGVALGRDLRGGVSFFIQGLFSGGWSEGGYSAIQIPCPDDWLPFLSLLHLLSKEEILSPQVLMSTLRTHCG